MQKIAIVFVILAIVEMTIAYFFNQKAILLASAILFLILVVAFMLLDKIRLKLVPAIGLNI